MPQGSGDLWAAHTPSYAKVKIVTPNIVRHVKPRKFNTEEIGSSRFTKLSQALCRRVVPRSLTSRLGYQKTPLTGRMNGVSNKKVKTDVELISVIICDTVSETRKSR